MARKSIPRSRTAGRDDQGHVGVRLASSPATISACCSAASSITPFPISGPKCMSRTMPRRKWKPAGVWYLAGSNTVVYSNPKEELGATEHNVETSNRRFRDDEFLVPRDLTRGRKAIRVRIKFTPVNRPLFPGYPVGDQPGAKSATPPTASSLPGADGRRSSGRRATDFC